MTLQKNNLDEEENIIMGGDFNCPLNPSIDKKGGIEFNPTEDQLEKIFLLPHIVCFESSVKAFQYKVRNSILYTNVKLCK